MQDNWWNHNTDKILLLTILLLAGGLIVHFVHHSMDDSLLAWAEHTFDVILGALVLILTGRNARADGQTANGLPPTPTEPPKP